MQQKVLNWLHEELLKKHFTKYQKQMEETCNNCCENIKKFFFNKCIDLIMLQLILLKNKTNKQKKKPISLEDFLKIYARMFAN